VGHDFVNSIKTIQEDVILHESLLKIHY